MDELLTSMTGSPANGMPFICGGSRAEVAPSKTGVVILPWVCPICDGTGRWDDKQRCEMCFGRGAIDDDDLGEWDRAELKRTTAPPGVMRSPCADCAFRPGSPESEHGAPPMPNSGEPFFCHHGMPVVAGSYAPTAWLDGRPLGAMVCAGWWAAQTGQPLPAGVYRPAKDGWGDHG